MSDKCNFTRLKKIDNSKQIIITIISLKMTGRNSTDKRSKRSYISAKCWNLSKITLKK